MSLTPVSTTSVRDEINGRLARHVNHRQGTRVDLAIAESLLGPGKRLRPILTVLSAKAFGREDDATLDFACAIEMLHTASLMLDDLPSMDNSRIRRGRATTHVAHGEGIAILAAVGLLTDAFHLLATTKGVDPATRLRAVEVVSHSIANPAGMIAGQETDLSSAADQTVDTEQICASKTGTLFAAAAQLGGLVAGAGTKELQVLSDLGMELGIAFQIADDLCDSYCGRTNHDMSAGARSMTRVAAHSAELMLSQRFANAHSLLHHLSTNTAPLIAYCELLARTVELQTSRVQAV